MRRIFVGCQVCCSNLINIIISIEFCKFSDSKYAHIVLTAGIEVNLFSWEHLKTLCKFEHYIMNSKLVEDLCISNNQMPGQCCRPWSIPNYIAAFFDKHSCLSITVMSFELMFYNFD